MKKKFFLLPVVLTVLGMFFMISCQEQHTEVNIRSISLSDSESGESTPSNVAIYTLSPGDTAFYTISVDIDGGQSADFMNITQYSCELDGAGSEDPISKVPTGSYCTSDIDNIDNFSLGALNSTLTFDAGENFTIKYYYVVPDYEWTSGTKKEVLNKFQVTANNGSISVAEGNDYRFKYEQP